MATPAGPPSLLVTSAPTMLHVQDCPHLGPEALASLAPASPEQIDSLPVCSSCRDVLEHGGRQTFDDLDAAMAALPVPLENRVRVRQIVRALTWSRLWIPASHSYIAVAGAPGQAATAYVNKGFVEVRTGPGDYDREWLPVNGDGAGGSQRRVEVARNLCPRCFVEMPASDRCDNCDA